MAKKLSIHFILPAGGLKGCFQAGFIYRLQKRYSHLFEIYQIDGCSAGSINGYAWASNHLEYLREVWMKVKKREDLFSSLSKIPVVNSIITGYNAIFGYGVYSNHKLKNYIDYNSEENDTTNNLSKFNCVVTNINLGNTQYINGTNPNIQQYVLASSSPWIISKPTLIDNSYYTDGALLDTYPMKNVETSKADKIVIVGYDATHDHLSNGLGKNMLEYLSHLINILRYHHHQYTKKIFDVHHDQFILIPNSICSMDFLNLHPDVIQQGFRDGEMAADRFAVEHLPVLSKKHKRLTKNLSEESFQETQTFLKPKYKEI